MSRLKQSNLAALTTTQKKTQERSLEEQVYEMPIENIEAERLRKTFHRICGDKVGSGSRLGDKEGRKAYISTHADSPSTRRT